MTVTVSANGYRNITVSGVEVMPDRLSIQDIELEVLDAPGNDVDNIVIPAHTPVSYTHLDVYKRQSDYCMLRIRVI